MPDLRGKCAIVTGGASGIGFGIASALAGAGANVVLGDINPGKLETARQAIEKLGVRSIGVTVDVSDPGSVAALGKAAEAAFGNIHIVANNAGVAMHGTPVEKVTLNEWNWVMGVNINGVINGIHALVPLIRRHEEGGHVVNTASISGFFVRAGRNQGAYAMTKYAVVALSEALEQELEGSGIGVSVLCPGAVQTGIFQSAATRPDKFGGAFERPEQTRMTDMLEGGLAPEQVGARVLRAIRDEEFYVFTHAGEREVIRERFARIDAAFDAVGKPAALRPVGTT